MQAEVLLSLFSQRPTRLHKTLNTGHIIKLLYRKQSVQLGYIKYKATQNVKYRSYHKATLAQTQRPTRLHSDNRLH